VPPHFDGQPTRMSATASEPGKFEGPREHLYYPAPTGSVFATPGQNVHVHLPFYGMVALSIDGTPIEVECGAHVVRHRAMAMWVKDAYFHTPNTRYVCVCVNPLHRDFRAFTQLSSPHMMPLDDAAYASFTPAMEKALTGNITYEETSKLFDGVMATTRALIPPPPPLDERAELFMRLLWADPRCSIAALAKHLNLSYHRTSHLFVEAVGLPVRTFQLWQKLYRSGAPLRAGASLTEAAHTAGFVDSAHFSRAFHTAFGRCPTEMFRTRSIRFFVPEAFDNPTVDRGQ
jgi:AraC family transcriptional regulator, arabinose operon regulatory protein